MGGFIINSGTFYTNQGDSSDVAAVSQLINATAAHHAFNFAACNGTIDSATPADVITFSAWSMQY